MHNTLDPCIAFASAFAEPKLPNRHSSTQKCILISKDHVSEYWTCKQDLNKRSDDLIYNNIYVEIDNHEKHYI